MPRKEAGTDLPKLAAPARRALGGAGVRSLADLATRRESEIAALHGMGPNALGALAAAPAAKASRFRQISKADA